MRLSSLRTKDWGLRTEDWGPRIEDRGLRTEDRGLRTEDRGLRIEDRGPRTEDWGLRTEDWGQPHSYWGPEAPVTIFLTRCLSKVWVKSHLSESNLSKKNTKKRVFATNPVSQQKCVFDIWTYIHTSMADLHNWSIWIESKKLNFDYGRVCLFAMHFLRLQLEEQSFPALSYFKLTLLANGADVCTMSVI